MENCPNTVLITLPLQGVGEALIQTLIVFDQNYFMEPIPNRILRALGQLTTAPRTIPTRPIYPQDILTLASSKFSFLESCRGAFIMLGEGVVQSRF